MIYYKRLRLRAVEHDDLQKFVAWLNDAEVIAGLSMYLPLSVMDEEAWYQGMRQRAPEERPLVIEVQEDNHWRMIGNIGLLNLDSRTRSCEVGIFIGEKSFWNRGYGTEAMKLILRLAFNTLNMNRVFLRVHETNPRAVRAYEKAGFILEGRERQGEFRNGLYCDVLHMSVLRAEWEDEV